MSSVEIGPPSRVDGEIRVPGDKSISHRALILGALAGGVSEVRNLSPAADVASTARCLEGCGAAIERDGGTAIIAGRRTGPSLSAPAATLDCGNSGTTMRLLSGVLAGHELEAVLDGDTSLRRRPMARVADPLTAMGAEVELTADGTAPIRVRGHRPLRAMEHTLPVASAQLKSALLLAGLFADATTAVTEPAASRDHTERLLRLCGADVRVDGLRITVEPHPEPLQPFTLAVPGDISSAAFLLALAAARPGWRVTCPGVTLNPGRTGVVEALHAMGAGITVEETAPAGGVEPVGTVTVEGGALHGCVIEGDLVARCIDEIPILALLACTAEGVTEIRDAAELRVKESDRIAEVASGLRALGARCEERPDGLRIEGPSRLRGGRLDARGDHRLAMTWAVAGCLLADPADRVVVDGAECVGVSYPSFFDDLDGLTAR